MNKLPFFAIALAALLCVGASGDTPSVRSARVVELQPGDVLVIKSGGKYWVFDSDGKVQPPADPAPRPPATYRVKVTASVDTITDPDKRANAAKLAEVFKLVAEQAKANGKITFAQAEQLQGQMVASLFGKSFTATWAPFAEVFKTEAKKRQADGTLEATHAELWATTALGLQDASGDAQAALSNDWRRLLQALFNSLLKALLERLT